VRRRRRGGLLVPALVRTQVARSRFPDGDRPVLRMASYRISRRASKQEHLPGIRQAGVEEHRRACNIGHCVGSILLAAGSFCNHSGGRGFLRGVL